MPDDYLDDEHRIAEERKRAEDRDVLALQQPISDLADLHPVVCVTAQTTVAAAVETMVQQAVGCLLVTDQTQLVGLFTERDVLCKVVAANVDPAKTLVSELMTHSPDTLNIDSPLVFALHRMAVGGYRHVPLLNQEGRPVAVVSMRDIVKHIVSLYPEQVFNLPDHPDHSHWKRRDGA